MMMMQLLLFKCKLRKDHEKSKTINLGELEKLSKAFLEKSLV